MKIRNIILIALFIALMAIGAKIQIPMLFIPITLQLLFCLMAGALLGPRLGALSQVLYIAIGVLGAPVFAGVPGGGFAYVLKPSFGYLIGFIVCAFVSGLLVERMKNLTFLKALLAMLAGIAAVYIIGVPYLYIMLSNTTNAITVDKAMVSYFLVFLPGDVIKCVIAALLTVKLRPVLLRKAQA